MKVRKKCEKAKDSDFIFCSQETRAEKVLNEFE